MSDSESWIAFKKSPEECYSMRQSADRQYRYWVWKTVNSPKSLRTEIYKMIPKFIVERVEERVKMLDKKHRRAK